ncbi:MAG: hypothetical protein Q9188_005666 [Gyalolechia gomerana]
MDDTIMILANKEEPSPIQATGSLRLKSSILHRSLTAEPLHVKSAKGSYLYLKDGKSILDASSGAAVACIGHGDEHVRKVMYDQMAKVSYVHAQMYTSGSEAMETALKLSRQYSLELNPPQPERHIFISRRQSYHGATLGALAVSGHLARRANYEPLMLPQMRQVSACNEYRYKSPGESTEEYVARLAQELEDEILDAGANKVCAFIAETIVGAYGVLLVLDEIMCGNGRCGSMHAWQAEAVVPDIQTIGKGLGGGYQPIAAVLLNRKVHGALESGTGSFAHGQTYQSHVLACAAALEVQRIIRSNDLIARCKSSGEYLEAALRKQIANHPYVGNVRGRGLFWGVEFVKDRATKEPFDVGDGIANAVHLLALERGVAIYPGVGTADGVHGDHVLVAPPYNISREEIDVMVSVTRNCIEDVFHSLGLQSSEVR